MSVEERISKLNLTLPEPKAPVGAYVATRLAGKLLYVSGQISIDKDGNLIKGKLGKDLDTSQGYEAAKRCGLAIVSQIKKACNNDFSKVKGCLKLTGYVNSTDTYTDQPLVINGASEIISKIFDTKELHTRAAISSNSLPLGVAVEVDAIFEIN